MFDPDSVGKRYVAHKNI